MCMCDMNSAHGCMCDHNVTEVRSTHGISRLALALALARCWVVPEVRGIPGPHLSTVREGMEGGARWAKPADGAVGLPGQLGCFIPQPVHSLAAAPALPPMLPQPICCQRPGRPLSGCTGCGAGQALNKLGAGWSAGPLVALPALCGW